MCFDMIIVQIWEGYGFLWTLKHFQYLTTPQITKVNRDPKVSDVSDRCRVNVDPRIFVIRNIDLYIGLST